MAPVTVTVLVTITVQVSGNSRDLTRYVEYGGAIGLYPSPRSRPLVQKLGCLAPQEGFFFVGGLHYMM